MQLPEGHIWPRVSVDGGESVRLCDALERIVLGPADVLAVIGPPGSGRTTTLNLLRSWRADRPANCFADDPLRRPDDRFGRDVEGPLFYTAEAPCVVPLTRTLRLAAWTEDDVIELALTRYRDDAKSILSRLLASPSRAVMDGLAAVVSAVVDEFAMQPGLSSVAEAVRRRSGLYAEGARSTPVPIAMIMRLLEPDSDDAAAAHLTHTWLLYRPVARLVLAEAVHSALAEHDDCTWLNLHFERSFLRASGEAIKGDEAATKHLLWMLPRQAITSHATAAGLLHAAGVVWQPAEKRRWILRGAVLPGIAWSGVTLASANLISANLNAADLSHAILHDADMSHAQLRGARLTKATLTRAYLAHADLSGADLTDACLAQVTCAETNMQNVTATRADLREATIEDTTLSGARLMQADFIRATIARVILDDADFSSAKFDEARLRDLDLRRCRLDGARFVGADLMRCNLEELVLPAPEFTGAVLICTDFTASVMPSANFAEARFRGCGLADVQWENVDLRDADLGKSTFHMGSSRSGLLFSPIASEGTRTGFYTEDINDWTHKPPEEIRKANLCGADLRGAKVLDTDFYLVDLRGARYSDQQATWFRKCGAILEG